MTDYRVVEIIIALVGFIAVFAAWINSSNKRWEEVNRNITENTMTLRQLQNYLNRLEDEFNRKLEKHEEHFDQVDKVLDDHELRIHDVEQEKNTWQTKNRQSAGLLPV